MSTKRLKKRDRAWARITVFRWKHGRGRRHSSDQWSRISSAQGARLWLTGNDPLQQEALKVWG
jgi:hypothetical protein